MGSIYSHWDGADCTAFFISVAARAYGLRSNEHRLARNSHLNTWHELFWSISRRHRAYLECISGLPPVTIALCGERCDCSVFAVCSHGQSHLSSFCVLC